MKSYIKRYKILFFLPLLAMGGLFTSCNDKEEVGEPQIHYIRVTEPTKSDSLLVEGRLANLIAIVGDNLGGTREIWFNDQQATLNPAYITNKSILVSIPNRSPIEVTNTMKLVFKDGRVLNHDFGVAIPAPEVNAMSNEYAMEGSTAIIEGNYYFNPISVTFTGGAVAEVVSVNQTEMEVIVPEGALSGPITVTSNFGTTESGFHYRDQRNLLLNYDDLTADGSWRPGVIGSEDGIDGNYLKLGSSELTYNANERIEDPYTSQFWGWTRWGAENPRQLFEGFPDDKVLKFEARVVDWYGSNLQIAWGPYSTANNSEAWGNLNGRGLWHPWKEDDKNFSTNGEWITVTLPLTEMVYRHEQTGGENLWIPDMKFDKDVAGTLTFWVIATPDAEASPVEIHIDNVRIVEM